ncbi:uncharacterized protein [Halyomorpha halys]|uniref:uncharacterized protein n=1 Tax=Halyomorpha halys TaxID=286706 RepID=UPI0006D4ED4E|nr:RNA polymerase II degradation factor 1-like [Halyomorpha halys]
MKLFLLVSLLGSALASAGEFSYSSYSTAYGPLARSALAYGSYGSSSLSAVSGYSASAPVYAAAPVTAYAAHAPVSAYAAHAPVTAYAAHAPVTAYAAHAPVAAYAAHAPVATYAAHTPVTAYAAAPVATYASAPAATYSIATAPAAAVVPVTKVSAQPAVVQNVVDVAQPKLATRRFEIRRPAIEKQFYDVEERVVVRPAGSAVVELETPVGADQRGATKITPAAPPVALRSYSSAHLATHFTPAVLPAAPVAVSSIHHHPQVIEQSHEIQQYPQQPEQVQQIESVQQISEQSESVQQIPQQPIPQPSLPQQDFSQQQFDDSDSVSVENPEFSARSESISSTPGSTPSPLFRSQLPAFPRAEAPLPQFSREQVFEQSNSEGLPSFSRSRASQYLQPEPLPLPQQRSELPPQSTLRPEYASSRQQQAEFSFARNQFQASSSRTSASLRQGPTSQPLLESDVEVNSYGSNQLIPSARHLSPEQSQANQARLIELLTARGPVTEVRSASEPIRGRVISATPAPPGAEPADERVNTRRIVVNRPIQTVQEVDVVEPFTKLERVAVHQPAVVKTAHVELAAVPAAVHTAVPAVHTAVHTGIPAAVTVAPYYHK